MGEARQTALIADDDEFFRIAVRSILIGRLGIAEVIETGSLEQALEELAEQRGAIAVAFFDLDMPGMRGPSSLAAVRERFPQVRAVVVSASQRRQDILAALEAGVHGYVAKGLKADDLAKALALILEGRVYVPPSLAELPAAGDSASAPGWTARPTGGAKGLAALSPRQRQVMQLLVAGRSNKEIARALNLGEGTVKVHLAALFRSLGVNNRAAAAAAGVRLLASGEEAG